MRVATRYYGVMAQQLLIDHVNDFLRQTGMAESAFGRQAVNDWKFVKSIRAGRRVWPETEDRVMAFMARHKPADAQVAA